MFFSFSIRFAIESWEDSVEEQVAEIGAAVAQAATWCRVLPQYYGGVPLKGVLGVIQGLKRV